MAVFLVRQKTDSGQEQVLIANVSVDSKDDLFEKNSLMVFSGVDEVKADVHRNVLDNILRAGGVTDIVWES